MHHQNMPLRYVVKKEKVMVQTLIDKISKAKYLRSIIFTAFIVIITITNMCTIIIPLHPNKN